MALNQPAFESEDFESTAAAVPAVIAPAAVPAVVTSGVSAVMRQNVYLPFKDAFRVTFDSLKAISASQGSFAFKDTDEDLGASITLGLMSYQYSWVASPKSNAADKTLLKYSDDGITSQDGCNMQEHIKALRAQGYPKANIVHRVILVGELVDCASGKSERMNTLIKIDLPDTGRKAFDDHALQASFQVARGNKTVQDISELKLKAVKDKTPSGDIYTKVVFV